MWNGVCLAGRCGLNVTVRNASGVGATGLFQFTVLESKVSLHEWMRVLDCNLRQLTRINRFVPPWVPVAGGDIKVNVEQLAKIVAQAEKVAATARSVLDAHAQASR